MNPLDQITLKQWRTLDASAIGALTRRKASNVRQYRSTYKKPKGPRSPGSGRPAKLDTGRIDWSLSNPENARRLGCTPQRIGQLRRARNEQEDFC